MVHLADYDQKSVLQVYNMLKLIPAIGLIILFFYKFSAKKFCPQIFPEVPVTSHRPSTIDRFMTPETTPDDARDGIFILHNPESVVFGRDSCKWGVCK